MIQRRLSDDEVQRLARYLFRAQLMRDHVHSLREEYEPNLTGLDKDNWWEFETYLNHWLGALFVLVEGFNKLKIQDARVRKLFNANIGALKQTRHETYHFVVQQAPVYATFIQSKGLNWAEELHDVIGDHIFTIVSRRATVERFVEKRKAKMK